MIRQKVRRLTIRIRNRGGASGREQEIGVTTVVATPGTAVATRRERPRREIVVAPADDAAPPAAPAGAPTTPLERLVAEAHERVLLLSRKSGRGVAQDSVLRRLAATGEISRRQHEAGMRYAAIVREHDLLLGRSVSRAATTTDHDDAEREAVSARASYRTAMARYDRCRAALRDAGREDRMAAAVVDAVAVNNWELPELTPALRIGLNHLARTMDAMTGEGEGAPTGWPAS